MTFPVFIDTTTGTYGDPAGLRVVEMEDYDLEFLESQSDSGINEYGKVNGEPLVPISDVVAWLNGVNGDLGDAFRAAFDPQTT